MGLYIVIRLLSILLSSPVVVLLDEGVTNVFDRVMGR